MRNNKVAPTADKSVHSVSSEELKTNPEFSQNHEKRPTSRNRKKKKSWYTAAVPSIFHYTVLFILGLLVWGWLWISWGEGWRWDGRWFRIVIVVVTSWASGVVLNSITTLPPLVASLLTGILARNLGYLDMRDFTHIDIFFRKIYPVIILGKGSLGWDTDFMMVNWKQISALGIIPWTAEVATLATSVHFFLGHPWIWGLVLGTFYASVTFPVVMPNVIRIGMSPRRTQNWPQLVATAGGIDTTLSVGVYGVLFGYLFSEPGISDSYRYFKAFSALFIGVVLGVVWGRLAGLIPHSKDTYVIELRVLFVLFGGIFLNFATTYIGWGGVATVAVLACNATAARYWAKKGWILNKNPASTAYRVIWSACEPTVFAFTGTFIVIDSHITSTLVKGFGILVICLTVRLAVAALMCWNLTAREKAFMCCVWSTKSIVEAVLCPTAINMLLERESSAEEMRYAEDFVILTVQEILVTTPVAFLLTRFLGPILIKDKKFAEGEESHA